MAYPATSAPSTLGPGGMPSSRRQMFDDMLIPENESVPSTAYARPPPHTQSAMGHHQAMPYSQQPQNYRTSSASSHSFNRPSSRTSSGNRSSAVSQSASSKSGIFGWGKKHAASHNDFDDDEGIDTVGYDMNMSGNSGYGANDMPDLSMKQLAGLRDRDRYPTMGPNDPNAGRTMSMTNSFDTTPIIPTFGGGDGKRANKDYRNNMISSRNQMIGNDNGYSHMHHMGPGPGYGGGYGPRSPTGPNGHPMDPNEMMRLRSMSNSTASLKNFSYDPNLPYDYPKPQNPGAAGRSMSMGGYSRGPPPPNLMPMMNGPPSPTGGHTGPNQNHRPPGRKSLPSHANSPPVSSNLTHSRSSSKSSSPSPAANSMSRPNSQALSASSSPEIISITSTPAVTKPFLPSTLTTTASTMTDVIPTINRATSPVPVPEILAIKTSVPGIDRSVSPVLIPSTELIDEASSPVNTFPEQKFFSEPATSDRSVSQTPDVSQSAPVSAPDPIPIVTPAPATATVPISVPVSADSLRQIEDLKHQNVRLMDEVRLVTSELADSIRRELGLSDISSSPDQFTEKLPEQTLEVSALPKNEAIEALSLNHRERATLVINLQSELDAERRKRMIAEENLYAKDNSISLKSLYDSAELESRLASSTHESTTKNMENESLKEQLKEMQEKYNALEDETSQLKNGTLPELKSHVESLELLTSVGNPVELLQTIDELKVENKKLSGLVEENSNRGPVGEKIKAIESQRDALREALRSLRERKDHEIRQYAERVRNLDAKLEKERVVNSQFQRKLVQGMRSTTSTSTSQPATSHSLTTPNDRMSPHLESFNLTLPKRHVPPSQLSIPTGGISSGPITPNTPRSGSPAPSLPRSVSPSLGISSDPSWIERHRVTPPPTGRLDHSPVPSMGSIYSFKSTISSSSLSLPNGRSEQIPLSLGFNS